MKLDDVRDEAVRRALSEMPGRFRTMQLSTHAEMVVAHRDFYENYRHYHARIGNYLSRNKSSLNIRCIDDRTNAVWEKVGWREPCDDCITSREEAVTAASHGLLGSGAPSRPVREGHNRSVDYMLTTEFASIKRLFESYPEIGGAHFRPVDRGITVVDLHPKSLKPRIGVGKDPCITPGATAAALAPTMEDRVDYLRRVRAVQTRPSLENRFEASIIREAQSNHLCIPGCPNNLRLIYSQWRIDSGTDGTQKFADLIAVDLVKLQLVILELKAQPDNSAFSQVQGYADYFSRYAENLVPFFVRVAQAMGTLYDCQELVSLGSLGSDITPMVAWPSADGKVVLMDIEGRTVSPSETAPQVRGASQREVVDTNDIGPQCASDKPFTARMRFHQSWFRSTVLGVPCGTGPNKSSSTHYGNMLGATEGERGLNFTSHDAFEAAKKRVAEGVGAVEPFRLFHNMLSSMPMCFNLFGPLAIDRGLATTALKALLGNGEVKSVREVAFEYAPQPQREYLNGGTAFDAFISYEHADGSLRFIGVETKLTEQFSQQHYDSPAYRRWVQQEDSPWPQESWGHLDRVQHNQLWRGHLLAVAMTMHPSSPYTSGRFGIVHHPGDVECSAVVEQYGRLLRPEDTSLIDLPLDRVVEAFEKVLPDTCADWLDKFRLRYLDLAASDADWQSRSL